MKETQEEQGEGDGERVLVEREDQPAPLHRPRRGFATSRGSRILVDGLFFPGRLRFRRSPLEEEHGEQHVGAHLEELAFPVLERGFAEVTGSQVLGQRERRFGIPASLVVVIEPTRPDLSAEATDEEEDEDDREPRCRATIAGRRSSTSYSTLIVLAMRSLLWTSANVQHD